MLNPLLTVKVNVSIKTMPISHSKYILFRQKVCNHNKYYFLTGESVKPEPTESPVPGRCYCYSSLCVCVFKSIVQILLSRMSYISGAE